MGLTPLAGIPMGTRCGDVDPSIIPIVMKLYDIKPDEMLRIMNKESGAWGVSGVSTDFRDIERAASAGDKRSILALESRAYIIAQYIAKMMVSLGGADYITFSGGIGENGFEESGHLSKFGSLDMYEIVKALVKNGFNGYVRPDHGRQIWGEKGKPGYGLYDRALGAAYFNGLWEAAIKEKK